MNIRASKKSICFFLLLIAIGLFLISSSSIIHAQANTHTVQKGDTLWDICERYYGDPDLWPKLWKMNPFITNPHLLSPGDVITLFGRETVKPEKAQDMPAIQKVEVKEPSPQGYDVTDMVNINCIAYLSKEPIIMWGTILSAEREKLILSEGDNAYILFDRGKNVKKGDVFYIVQPSPVLKDPKKRIIGYSFSVLGKIMIDKPSAQAMLEGKITDRKNVYDARITDNYAPIQIGDRLIPFEPVSPCVLPQPGNVDLLGNIVAAKDQQQLLCEGSIVYIDRGFNHGIKRGNLLEIVRANIMPDPDPDPPGVRYLADKRGTMILPDVHLGTALVLDSRPETSTAIVLSADDLIVPGVFVKNMKWEDVPENIPMISRCPVK